MRLFWQAGLFSSPGVCDGISTRERFGRSNKCRRPFQKAPRPLLASGPMHIPSADLDRADPWNPVLPLTSAFLTSGIEARRVADFGPSGSHARGDLQMPGQLRPLQIVTVLFPPSATSFRHFVPFNSLPATRNFLPVRSFTCRPTHFSSFVSRYFPPLRHFRDPVRDFLRPVRHFPHPVRDFRHPVTYSNRVTSYSNRPTSDSRALPTNSNRAPSASNRVASPQNRVPTQSHRLARC